MKRALSVLFVSLVFLIAFASVSPLFARVSAAGVDYMNESTGRAFDNAINGKLNSTGYTGLQVNALMAKFSCDILPAPHICTENQATLMNLQQKSVIGALSSTIYAMYANPAATGEYAFRDIGESLGFLPKRTFAQGIGFVGLSPLLPIWKVFRNMAYLLLSVVMIVIGFMVMFRKKIDPKTVVTVQNALPKIVVTILLITFSYAIVGIMIDAMYLVILFATAIVKQTGMLPEPQWIEKATGAPSIETVLTNGNLFSLHGLLFPLRPWTGSVVSAGTLDKLAQNIIGLDWFTKQFNNITGASNFPFVGNLIGPLIVSNIAFPVTLLVYLLLTIALLFTYIRLFFLFVNAYVGIILSLVTAPLQLLTEAIPGVNGFESWFKNLFSNIAVFPVCAIMFLIAIFLIGATDKVQGSLWTPPFITFYYGDSRSISALFALGVLMSAPTIAAGIKKSLKAESPIPAGPGSLLSPVTGAVQTGLGVGQQFYYAGTTMSWLGGWIERQKQGHTPPGK